MFMHNGFIGGWNVLRREIEELIPDDLYPSRLGTTDSEAIFLAIMGRGILDDPIGATARTLTAVAQLANRAGSAHALRFTAALTNGRDLYAFRCSVNDAANTLYYRSNSNGTAIVSEPVDENHSDWIEVPRNRVLVARAGLPIEILPFLDEKRVAAE